MRAQAMRMFTIAAVALGGVRCGDGADPTIGDGGTGSKAGDGARLADGGGADARARGLVVTLRALTLGPIFPYDPLKNENKIVVRFEVTVQNHGPSDLHDLRFVFPVPKGLEGSVTMRVGGGWYNDALKSGLRLFDWLPPETGPVKFEITLERDPKVLQAENPEGVYGILDIRASALVLQYDREIARSADVAIRVHAPERLSPQEFVDLYSGQRTGSALFLSARPRTGEHGGKGGIYRVSDDGKVTPVAQHGRVEYVGPFLVEGSALYFGSDVSNGRGGHRNTLLAAPADGSGPAKEVPVPELRTVMAIGADVTHVFVAYDRTDNVRVLHRFAKIDPMAGTATSLALGDLVSDTISVTGQYVVLRRSSPAALLRLRKDTLEITKICDLSSDPGRRTMTCSDTTCYYAEWTDGLWQVPIEGGEAIYLISTNQPFAFDGKQFYSGINGLVRVGPHRHPAGQRLFQGPVVQVLAADDTYVYFQTDHRIWRLPK